MSLVPLSPRKITVVLDRTFCGLAEMLQLCAVAKPSRQPISLSSRESIDAYIAAFVPPPVVGQAAPVSGTLCSGLCGALNATQANHGSGAVAIQWLAAVTVSVVA